MGCLVADKRPHRIFASRLHDIDRQMGYEKGGEDESGRKEAEERPGDGPCKKGDDADVEIEVPRPPSILIFAVDPSIRLQYEIRQHMREDQENQEEQAR